jgi:chorismate mutase
MPKPSKGRAQLSKVRRQIDRLDERLLRLVNQRAMYALAIGRIKKARKWPVFDAARETFVLNHVVQANRGPLSPGAVKHIFQSVLTECRRRQRRTRRRAGR